MAKSSFAALAAVSVVFVLACEQAPTSADLLKPPDIRAAVMMVNDNIRLPVTRTLNNPCKPGVPIDLTGTQHRIRQIRDTDGSGNISPGDHIKVHREEALKGTDSEGVRYTATDVLNFEGRVQSSPYTNSHVQRVISSTGVDNFLVRTNLTINANGVVTVDLHSDKCVG